MPLLPVGVLGEMEASSVFGRPALHSKLPVAETQVLGHPSFSVSLYLLIKCLLFAPQTA